MWRRLSVLCRHQIDQVYDLTYHLEIVDQRDQPFACRFR
jgi:hypothetical protein